MTDETEHDIPYSRKVRVGDFIENQWFTPAGEYITTLGRVRACDVPAAIEVGELYFKLTSDPEWYNTTYVCANPDVIACISLRLECSGGGDPWVATLRREMKGPSEVGMGPSVLAALRQLVGVCVHACRQAEEEAQAIMHRARQHVEVASKLGLIVGAAEEAERQGKEGSDGS
jgi:hypothetical protein